jgi:hypothetical protein
MFIVYATATPTKYNVFEVGLGFGLGLLLTVELLFFAGLWYIRRSRKTIQTRSQPEGAYLQEREN